MVKPLPPNDFRATRYQLEDKDFGLVKDEESIDYNVSQRRIKKSVWKGIMTLTDDVVVRTTDFYGQEIENIDTLQDHWSTFGYHIEFDKETNCQKKDYDESLSNLAFFIFDEIQAFLFNSLHGFYRQSLMMLRCIIENTLKYVLTRKNIPFGEREGFSSLVSKLNTANHQQSLTILLSNKTNDSILIGFFDDMSSCIHSRIENFHFWESSGPVYSAKAFLMIYTFFILCNCICVLLLSTFAKEAQQPNEDLVAIVRLSQTLATSLKGMNFNAFYTYKHNPMLFKTFARLDNILSLLSTI